MHRDPIVEEMRRIKEARAKRYNYDIRAMARALRVAQRRNRKRVVSLAPRRRSVAAAN